MNESALIALFDDTEHRIRCGDIFGAMENLDVSLGSGRKTGGGASWSLRAREVYLAHTIHQVLAEEPVTREAEERLRGYAGDAGLLDYIYQCRALPERTSQIGLTLYQWGLQTPAQRSVRARSSFVADYIDQAGAKVGPGLEMLSVACGHLREARVSRVLRERRFHRCLCLDQDRLSLEVVDRDYGTLGVQVVHETVRRLALGKTRLRAFDLIYASGLYDYLLDPFASRLTDTLVSMLKPGGRLLVANFTPLLRDIGYMEVIMDWRLVYRMACGLELLCSSARLVDSFRTFEGAEGNLIYGEVVRSC